MFSLRNKKKFSLNYPQYPLLSGALISSVTGLLHNRIMTSNTLEYLSLNMNILCMYSQLLISQTLVSQSTLISKNVTLQRRYTADR